MRGRDTGELDTSDVFRQAIRRVFETSGSVLREAIKACPDDLWDDPITGTRRSGTSLARRRFIRTCICPSRGTISSRPILTSTNTTACRATCSVVLLAAVQSVFAVDHELHVIGTLFVPRSPVLSEISRR
jgi:hypothetical protein